MTEPEVPPPYAVEPVKPPMPDNLRGLAEGAIARHRKRRMPPDIVTRAEEMGYYQHLTCPFRDEDEELWLALLLECFGTRSYSVAQSFMRQLAALVPSVLYDGERSIRADEEAMYQALAIVCSLKPRNEAEAAHAAQLVAVHLASMRVGGHLGRASGYADPRTVASLALLTKTFGEGVDRLQRRGRRKPAVQVIKVEKRVNVYNDNRSVTVPTGGCDNRNSRPHASGELRAREAGSNTGPNERPALPSPDQGGRVVPWPGGEGEAGLSDARSRERIRRAEG